MPTKLRYDESSQSLNNMNASHLFREHLPYTIKMLYGTITEAGKSKNEVTNNALMDAFCTNARALLEFFEKEHKRKTYTDCPSSNASGQSEQCWNGGSGSFGVGV